MVSASFQKYLVCYNHGQLSNLVALTMDTMAVVIAFYINLLFNNKPIYASVQLGFLVFIMGLHYVIWVMGHGLVPGFSKSQNL